eukprot:1871500-Alexandrium_andersonii.AAC.1
MSSMHACISSPSPQSVERVATALASAEPAEPSVPWRSVMALWGLSTCWCCTFACEGLGEGGGR